MSRMPHDHVRRRTTLVIPGLQGGAAACLGAVVLAAAVLIASLLFRDMRQALRDAAYGGHYAFAAPFDVVQVVAGRWLFALAVLVFGGGSLVFLWAVRRVRGGIFPLVASLRASAEGDLSTPTKARGPRALADAGEEIDEVRRRVLAVIGEIREEAAAIRAFSPPDQEFSLRWAALKEKIGGILP